MSEEQLAALKLEEVVQDFEVWEDNRQIVEMFMRMQTQWRTSMSGAVGLDYAALEWLCRLYPVDNPQELFEGLQVMEYTALNCFNKKN
jgi:hypothetical protein|nr:hypothetical protein [uncultured Mediterranean phage uvMED]BAR23558.1 hypothetical protein [uncultured Mediterranean phage uvMED]